MIKNIDIEKAKKLHQRMTGGSDGADSREGFTSPFSQPLLSRNRSTLPNGRLLGKDGETIDLTADHSRDSNTPSSKDIINTKRSNNHGANNMAEKQHTAGSPKKKRRTNTSRMEIV